MSDCWSDATLSRTLQVVSNHFETCFQFLYRIQYINIIFQNIPCKKMENELKVDFSNTFSGAKMPNSPETRLGYGFHLNMA